MGLIKPKPLQDSAMTETLSLSDPKPLPEALDLNSFKEHVVLGFWSPVENLYQCLFCLYGSTINHRTPFVSVFKSTK